MSEAEIVRVIAMFEASRVRWGLVGGYAYSLVVEPRCTDDFDFIVDAARANLVLRGLTKIFGALGERDNGTAIRLSAIDVDLIRSTHHPLFEAALKLQRKIGDWRVPRVEVLVVLKFLLSRSQGRDRVKQTYDMAQLIALYHAAERKLDRSMMVELSRLGYPGAETEFRELIGKIDRDEPIAI